MSIAEKLQTIAQNEPRVREAGRVQGYQDGYSSGYMEGDTNGYNRGYEAGVAAGGGGASYEQGVADGRQAEYDAFWDAYQDFGKRTNYARAFQGQGWTDTTFRPKYDIAPTIGDGAAMFFSARITDLASRLNECGVSLDTSGMTSFANMFQGSACTVLPPLDLKKASVATNLFYGCRTLKTASLINVTEACTFASAFYAAGDLENLTITGTIGQDIDFSACTKLSRGSLLSIGFALSTTSVGKTIKLPPRDYVYGLFADNPLEWGQREIDHPNWSFAWA